MSNTPILELAAARNNAVAAASRLTNAVAECRRLGISWQAITDTLGLAGHGGHRYPLGELFPNGTSVTTVKRHYEWRIKR